MIDPRQNNRHPVYQGRWKNTLLLMAILILGTILRFWNLETFPPGLYHDEAYNGLDALALVQGEKFPIFHESWELYAQDAHANAPARPTRTPIFFEGNYGREPLHLYLMGASIKLFGATRFALRAVDASAGVVAILTTYLVALALFDQDPNRHRIALIAAFGLAVSFPALHFSRFALRMMLFLPPSSLAILCFWRGWIRPKQTLFYWILAGILIGSGLYIYAAARLFPLVFLLFMAIHWAHQRKNWGRELLYFSALGMAALLTATPALLYFFEYPYFFVFRMLYVANKGKGAVENNASMTWLLNIGRTIRGIYYFGETHLRHNLPARPFLDGIQATLLTLGGWQSVRQWRHPRSLLLGLWLMVMLFPTIFSGDAPHFGRMSGALPPLVILSAVGLDFLWRQLARWPKVAPTVPLLLCLLSGAWTIRDYFGRYAAIPALSDGLYPTNTGFYLPDWEIGRTIAALSAETVVYFTPPQEEMATIFYAMGGEKDRLHDYNGEQGLIPAGIEGRPMLYLIRPNAKETLAHLRNFYGDDLRIEEGETMIKGWVSAEAPRLRIEHQKSEPFNSTLSLVGWSEKRTDTQLIVTLAWQSAEPMQSAYTAYVHVLDAQGNLIAQNDHPPTGYPTHDWRVGELIYDHYTIDLPIGTTIAQLRTGFYDSATLAPFGAALSLHP